MHLAAAYIVSAACAEASRQNILCKLHYTIPGEEHPPSHMIWSTYDHNGSTGLYTFLSNKITVRSKRSVKSNFPF